MQNIGGGWQAAVSLAGLGQQSVLIVFAEHETTPWDPLRIDHGFAAEETVITVFRAETVVNVTGGLAELASVMGVPPRVFGGIWAIRW